MKNTKLGKGLKVLKNHASEELRIHKELLKESQDDVKHLLRKHLKDTVAIHKTFWNELKKIVKEK
jgi:hypothetical protein